MPADLHIHTTASDGRFSPDAVLSMALQCGLSYIAITDHDTVDGLISLNNSLKSIVADIIVIPGIEFSIDLPNHEVHILGYYINPFDHRLHEQLKVIVEDRRQRIQKIVMKLNELGYCLTVKDIMEAAKDATSIGRPYIARALVAKGYFHTVSEVFERLLYKNGPAYVSHYKLSPEHAIDLISKCGGIPVLAHPGLIGDDAIVQKMVNYGVRGIEVYHPKHNSTQTNHYKQLAAKNKMLITGGSDFHGIPSRYPEQLGVFTVPDELAIRLREYGHA